MIDELVRLNETEQRLARVIIDCRRQAAADTGRVNNLLCHRVNPYKQDVDAYGAELATARLFNVYPDTVIVYSGPTPKVDLTIPGVGRVDVKNTPRTDGRMLVTPRSAEHDDVDYFLLMVGKMPAYRYKGVITRHAVMAYPLTDLGCGECYAIPQSDLRHIA